MSCVITYKGQKYSEEQFKEYFINNKQEFATSIAKNKNVIDSFKRKMEGINYVFSQSPELASVGSKAQYLQYLSTIFPNSKVKETVYHNTTTDFEEFKVGKDGAIHFGDKEAARQRTKNVVGVKFTKESKINIENLTEGVDSLDFDPPTNATKEEKAIYFELLKKADNETKEHIIALYKSGKISLEQAHKLIDEGWSLEKIYKELFNANGYFYINQAENKGSISYVVFKPEQIHVLGSKQDIEGFKDFVQGKQFQKLTAEEKAKTIEQVTKEHRSITALKDLSAKLAHRIGGKVQFENKTDVDWKGYNQGNTSVLNEAYMDESTAFHEIAFHPIIRALKSMSSQKESVTLQQMVDNQEIEKKCN